MASAALASYSDLHDAVLRLNAITESTPMRSPSTSSNTLLAEAAAAAAAECRQIRSLMQAAMGGDRRIVVSSRDVVVINTTVQSHLEALEAAFRRGRFSRHPEAGEGVEEDDDDHDDRNDTSPLRIFDGLRRALVQARADIRSSQLLPASSASEEGGDAAEDDEDDGQTLREVSEATGTSIALLKQVNPFLAAYGPEDLVPAGTSIVLPAKVESELQQRDQATRAAPGFYASTTDYETATSNDGAARAGPASAAPVLETLASIAHRAGMPLSRLVSVNPHLAAFDPVSDPLPIGTAVNIPRNKAASPAPRRRSSQQPPPRSASREARSQTNEGEESFAQIATNTGVSLADLRLANPELAEKFHPTAPLPANTILKIPDVLLRHRKDAPSASSPSSLTASGTNAAGSPSRPQAETLRSIAWMHGVPTAMFRDLNPHLANYASDEELAPGSSLIVPRPKSGASTTIAGNNSSSSHRNQQPRAAGETLHEIAVLYDIGVEKLLSCNPHLKGFDKNAPLPPGVAVEIPKNSLQRMRSPPSSVSPAAPSPSTTPMRRAAPGSDDTLDTIRKLASSFNISTELFRRKNPHISALADDEVIPSGTALRVPSPVKRPQSNPSPFVTPTRHAAIPAASLRTVAEHEGISVTEIRTLNPTVAGLREDEPLPANITLKVPKKKKKQTPAPATGTKKSSRPHPSSSAALERAEERRGDKDEEEDGGGGVDTVRSVARRFNITEERLIEWNPSLAPLDPNAPIPDKTELKIPTPAAASSSASPGRNKPQNITQQPTQGSSRKSGGGGGFDGYTAASTSTDDYYTTTSGAGEEQAANSRNTIRFIAKQFGVSEALLRSANPSLLAGLHSDALLPLGVSLRIPRGSPSSQPQTLAELSLATGVPVDVIRKQNRNLGGVDSDEELPVGTSIQLPTQKDRSAAATAATRRQHQPHHRAAAATTNDSSEEEEEYTTNQENGGHHRDEAEDDEGVGEGPRRNTLRDIARYYGVSVDSIVAHNPHVRRFDPEEDLPEDTRLNIPLQEETTPAAASPARQPTSTATSGEAPCPPTNAPLPHTPGARQGAPVPAAASVAATKPHAVCERRESLRSIASQYNVTVSRLRSANLATLQSVESSDAFLPIGTVLAIPDDDNDAPPRPQQQQAAAAGEVAQHQENAKKGVSAADGLHEASERRNHHHPSFNPGSGGDTVSPQPPPLRTKQHLFPVQAGERIGDVARRLNVSEAALRNANPQLRNVHFKTPLPPDTIVELPSTEPPHSSSLSSVSNPAPATSSSPPQLAKLSSGNGRRTVVSNGELSVADICHLYFIAEDSLRAQNPFLRRYHSATLIPEGTVLVLEAHHPISSSGGESQQHPREFVVSEPQTTLKTICDVSGVTERRIRRLNPHLALVKLSTELPIGSVVTTDVPLQLYHRQGIDRYLVVRTIAQNSTALLCQRYFGLWRLFVSAFCSSRMAEAKARDMERQRMEYQLQVGRLSEADLKRRVTELRMTVDSMRPTSVASQMAVARLVSQTVAGHEEAAQFEREALTAAIGAAAAVAANKPVPMTPSSAALTADTSGLSWMGQPVFVPSSSPKKRAVSPVASHVPRTLSPGNRLSSSSSAPGVNNDRSSAEALLGIAVADMVIARVLAPAAAASGVKPGDLITRVDGKLINSSLALQQAIKRATGPRVLLTVRDATTGNVTAHHVPLRLGAGEMNASAMSSGSARGGMGLVASPARSTSGQPSQSPSVARRRLSPAAHRSISQGSQSVADRNSSGGAQYRGIGVPLHLSPKRAANY
jgi:LysM repeat protein